MNSRDDSIKTKGPIEDEAQELFRAKQRRRRELANLPFEKKIRILVDLQEIANDIRETLGRSKRRSWDIRGSRSGLRVHAVTLREGKQISK